MIDGFHGPLHGDMLGAALELEAPNDLALQLGQAEPFYSALRATKCYGLSGMGENDTHRLAGSDAIAWGAMLRSLIDVLRVLGETDAQRFARLWRSLPACICTGRRAPSTRATQGRTRAPSGCSAWATT